MLSSEDIQKALHAQRVVELNLPVPRGPIDLEHLAVVVKELQSKPAPSSGRGHETITITLRSETREKLERLAADQHGLGSPTPQVTAADVASAIVERFVTSS